MSTPPMTFHRPLLILDLGRDLERDEAAVTCTRDGKVRAVSLEIELILDMIRSGSASCWFHGGKKLPVSHWGEGPGSQQTTTDFLIYSLSKFPAFQFQRTKAEGIFFFVWSDCFHGIKIFHSNFCFFSKPFISKVVLLKLQFKKKKLCLSLQSYQIAAFVKQSFVGLTNMFELNSFFWFELSVVKNIPMDSIWDLLLYASKNKKIELKSVMKQNVFYSPWDKLQVQQCLWETGNWREIFKHFSVPRKPYTHQLFLLQLEVLWSWDIQRVLNKILNQKKPHLHSEYEVKTRFVESLTEISVLGLPWGVDPMIQPSFLVIFALKASKRTFKSLKILLLLVCLES